MRQQLKLKFWSITLFDDKARFETLGTRTISIPAKALKSSESLYAWLLERAEKFFKDAKATCKY